MRLVPGIPGPATLDLHIHSHHSDGAQTPAQIVSAARAAGLSLISVADHNTVAAYRELPELCRQAGLAYIPGVELDCLHRGHSYHLLAYGFDPGDRDFAGLFANSPGLLDGMSDELIRRLCPEYPQLSPADYAAFAYDRTRGGWKGLHYLVARGVIPCPEAGLPLYGRYGIRYEDCPFPSLQEACAAVHRAGAVAVLAHPGNWFTADTPDLWALLADFAAAGVDGFECRYPNHSARLTRILLDFCRERGLYAAAGGDGHGAFLRVSRGVVYDIGVLGATCASLGWEEPAAPAPRFPCPLYRG